MTKVISIGNISLGGTGKTPFTIMLARHFIDAGKRVCILSRGYKGGLGTDTNIISNGTDILHDPPDAADEPYMMARACPGAVVITGAERTESFRLAKEIDNPDIVLLDDAFQHRRMPRDIDILLMDHRNPVSTGFRFPFGYLRESPKAVRRADMVVFTRATDETVPKKVEKYLGDTPVFFADIETTGVSGGLKSRPIELWRVRPVFAFSAIANNAGFVRTLQKLGVRVVDSKGFRDHHHFSGRDLGSIEFAAIESGADSMITTEKDWVRLPDAWRKKVSYLAIRTRLFDERAFFETLDRMVEEIGE